MLIITKKNINNKWNLKKKHSFRNPGTNFRQMLWTNGQSKKIQKKRIL